MDPDKTTAEPPPITPAPDTPPPADPPQGGKDDPLIQTLLADLEVNVTELGEPADIPPAPEGDTPPPADPPPSDPPAKTDDDPPPATKPKKFTKLPPADPPPLPKADPPPAPEPQAPTAKDPDAGLDEDLRDDIERAQVAERLFPDRYKGFSQKYRDFAGKLDAYIAKAREEDPDRTLDEDDEQFQRWVKNNRPQWGSRADARKVEHEMIESRVADRIARERESVEERIRQVEVTPRIESRVAKFEQQLTEQLGEDYGDAIKQAGLDGAAEKFPFEADAVRAANTRTQQLASEFLALSHGVAKPDFDKNPDHLWLYNFMESQGSHFHANGAEKRTDSAGRTFLPRSAYNQLRRTNPAEAQKHWTFSDEHVLAMLAHNAKMNVEERVKAERERLRKAGYTRETKQPAPPPKSDPAPRRETPPSPKASTSAAPGAASGKPQEPDSPGLDVARSLGMI
jgi:hypothetical protein